MPLEMAGTGGVHEPGANSRGASSGEPLAACTASAQLASVTELRVLGRIHNLPKCLNFFPSLVSLEARGFCDADLAALASGAARLRRLVCRKCDSITREGYSLLSRMEGLTIAGELAVQRNCWFV